MENKVVWDCSRLNTHPQELILDTEKTAFICISGGLYQISFGFFSAKKPMVQILLNDEAIIGATRKKRTPEFGEYEVKHASGSVVGLTCVDFVIVPPRGKISVLYEGSRKSEGFIWFKKI